MPGRQSMPRRVRIFLHCWVRVPRGILGWQPAPLPGRVVLYVYCAHVAKGLHGLSAGVLLPDAYQMEQDHVSWLIRRRCPTQVNI